MKFITFIAKIVLIGIEKAFRIIETAESFLLKKRKTKSTHQHITHREVSAKQAAMLAIAYLEEAYKRLAGEPLSLGAKLVFTEIIARRSAKYELVSTPETFRLGVISYFALIATMYPERDIFGVIITDGSSEDYLYEQDLYGPNKISVRDYLSAFGISVKPFSIYIQEARNNVSPLKGRKVLTITHEPGFRLHAEGYKGIEMFPIIKDNGKIASMVNYNNAFRKLL